MKKFYLFFFIVATTFGVSSCDVSDGQGMYLGKSKNYDAFLWSESNWDKNILPEQTLQYKMGDIKFTKPVIIQVVYEDENGDYQPVNNPNERMITILKNRKIIKNSEITIQPNEKSVDLQFRFNKCKGENFRKVKLSLKILDPGDLDLINGQEAKVGSILDTSILWQAKYEYGWNPLQTTLMWLGIFIVSLLVFWFLIFRRIIFPTFSFDNLQVIYIDGESKNGREDCSLRGARKIICSVSPKSQSGLNKFFCGRIEYLTNPFWKSPVIMKPCGSNGISINEDMKAGNAANYRMTSMITPQNGPRRPFVVKRVKTEQIANISIG